ncbi:hypothetical protein T484DRAFT_1768680, partial [Baffinella frigidus]
DELRDTVERLQDELQEAHTASAGEVQRLCREVERLEAASSKEAAGSSAEDARLAKEVARLQAAALGEQERRRAAREDVSLLEAKFETAVGHAAVTRGELVEAVKEVRVLEGQLEEQEARLEGQRATASKLAEANERLEDERRTLRENLAQ